MKKIITLTESDLTRIVKRIVKEQNEKKLIDYVLKPSLTLDELIKQNTEVIKRNQKFLNKKYGLNLPIDGKISNEYTKHLNRHLELLNISKKDRTLLGSLSNMIPIYETILDIGSIVSGIVNGDKQELLGGIAGLAAEGISYKAVVNLLDYVTEKGMGKKEADTWAKKRKDILDMTDYEREQLFIRYGYGGYDKWVKDGVPDLN
jgi:hypothetical protein